jgi:pyruvate/2-oxoglutarate dehydrogenase complex dihydrolipoamide acyltransferase (E2) component
VIDVKMPQLGESVERGTVTRWLKAIGDAVAVDEPLFEVSSDKVTMEVPSLAAGTLGERLVAEGEEVPVGTVVARIANGEVRAARRGGRERLSPVVRRLAREHAVDLSRITGSAAGGRITKKDVLAAVSRAPDGAEPLSPLRRTLVQRLSAAQKSAVNVFSVVEIDMEAVATERKRRGLTYLPFVARAVVDALRAVPALNASLDESAAALIRHDAVHLGIAVDLEERGLVVPVVRDAQRLTIDGLAAEIARVADGARSGSLPAESYAGATFTITNNGAFGTLMTAPVINPPNVAIVSTDAVEERPVAINGMLGIRRRMYCCMTWDHRAFDGSTAAKFLGRIKLALEQWEWSTR